MNLQRGAIILCGGRSSRMGCDKALLPFGPDETLLQRVVRIVGGVVPLERMVCVAAMGQELPVLPAEVRVVRDQEPNCGPLAGLVTGLAALSGKADTVFASGCDVPLLRPALIEQLLELLGTHAAAVPGAGEQIHPLPAVYRADVLPIAQSLLGRGEQSLRALVAVCDVRRVGVDEMRTFDPELNSLLNCNTPEEYRRVLDLALASEGNS